MMEFLMTVSFDDEVASIDSQPNVTRMMDHNVSNDLKLIVSWMALNSKDDDDNDKDDLMMMLIKYM